MANKKIRTRPGAREPKRAAILQGARAVFARDGYTRASIDAISAEAGVSTRTIYNHFSSKDDLFHEVLVGSASQVSEAFATLVERDLQGRDAIEDLTALGLALSSARSAFPEHFALVRQVNADGFHFPDATIAAWQSAGPGRMEQEVADRLAAMAERGWLRVENPRRAASHFIAITAAEVTASSARHLPPPSAKARRDRVAAAVDAFVHGYGVSRA